MNARGSWPAVFWRILPASPVMLVLAACAEDIEGPALGIEAPAVGLTPPPADPGILCRDQRTTEVVVSAEGMSALPFDLAHDPRIMLPDIVLARRSALDGGAADPLEVRYSGHPDVAGNRSLLSWQSQRQMSFVVLPSCASAADCADGATCDAAGVCAPTGTGDDLSGPLAEGLFDVRIENPNGSEATSPGALAVIARPTLATLTPPIVCLAQGSRPVTLDGTRFLTIEEREAVVTIEGVAEPFAIDDGTFTGCAAIPHAGYTTLRTCTGATITLPRDGVAVGYPAVRVDNPETAACISEEVVNLRVVPPPRITAIAAREDDPAAVSDGDGTIICLAEGPREVILHGSDFLGIAPPAGAELLPHVTVDGRAVAVKSLAACEDLPTMGLTVRRCDEVVVELPVALAAEDEPYQALVTVTNPEPAVCSDATEAARSNLLTIAPPPDVIAVEPPLVCLDDGERTVIVHGTDFLAIDGAVPQVTLADLTIDPSAVVPGACAPLDVANKIVERCRELAVTIPQASLDLGQPAVRVDNPLPAGCSDSEDGILTIVAGPTLTAAIPPLVCTADGARTVTLEGTGFITIDGAPPTVLLDGAPFLATAASGCSAVPVDGLVVEQCTSLEVALPAGSLMPGDTLVEVVNGPPGAGCSIGDDAILTVPPAVELVSVAPGAVCVGGASVVQLTISGAGFLRIGEADFTLTIGGEAIVPDAIEGCTALDVADLDVQSCDTIVATFDATGLPVGPVPIAIGNPAPSGCGVFSDDAFNIAPPPSLTAIEPAEVCESEAETFVLTGTGFVSTTIVRADGITASAVSLRPDGRLEATFAGGLPAGLYDITLDNGDGCTTTTTAVLTVHPTPLVFFVDPPVVYNGIITEATIYVSNLDQTAAEVELIAADGTVVALTDFQSPERPGRIQARVPADLAPGRYEVSVTSVYACTSSLNGTLQITDTESLVVAIDPAFASPTQPTPITVREAGDAFLPVPRVYLNPAGGGALARPVRAVVLEDAGTLNGVVPEGLSPGDYDVIVVNPNGEVAVLEAGLVVTSGEPPIVTSVAPGSFDANAALQAGVVLGANFGSDAATMDVALSCVDFATGAATPSGRVSVTAASAGALEFTLDPSGMSAGSVCLVIVTNPDGASYEYSAISLKEPAQNLNRWRGALAGTPSMQEARRALALVAGRPTDRSRFLYAVGGDDGTDPGVKSSVESVPVGVYGNLGAWSFQRNDLTRVWDPGAAAFTAAPRAFAQVARVGRFLYLSGGRGAAGSERTVLRSEILDPLAGPEILDLDAALGDGSKGLANGVYYYRVAALFPTSDPANPGGESLPGEVFTVQLPEVAGGLVLTLAWQAIPGARGYRLYRTPAPDGVATDLQLLVETSGLQATSFVDDGTKATTQGVTPFSQGSLGVWHHVAALETARHAHGAVAVQDPATPTRWFLYAGGGRDGGSALSSIERATVTIAPGGRQTIGAWTSAGASLGAARAELGALTIGPADTDLITDPSAVYVYFTQGRANQMVSRFEGARVGPDGVLMDLTQLGGPTPSRAGAVDLAANGWLFLLGGSNGNPSNGNDTSAELTSSPPALSQWDALGGGAMTEPRLFADGAKESAFFFIAGGTAGSGALATVEQTIQ